MFLNYNIDFPSLYQRDGLIQIDNLFLDNLKKQDPSLYQKLLDIRIDHLSDNQSKLIIELAPYLEHFIGDLFFIKDELEQLKSKHDSLKNLYLCKKLFIQRRVLKNYNKDQVEESFALLYNFSNELEFANHVISMLKDEEQNKLELEKAAKYAAWAFYYNSNHDSILFTIPKKTDYDNLVELEEYQDQGVKVLKSAKIRYRDGFNFTDKVPTLEKSLDQANYCIFCHNQEKDSCSKGLKDNDNNFKSNPLGMELIGCPLEEKISEMNYLKSIGCIIGSLATAMIDNPLLAATGDRICNECIRSCIYQKQEGVDIPKIESRILYDVLDLPWGFEIYSLLSRWNPLNFNRYLPKEDTNYKILIVGLGPAGFNLAHHLLNDGHIIVAIDGLKIEPLAKEISGIDVDGNRYNFEPIKDLKTLFEDLDNRIPAGFGGVAEYGITVRWNKNYLKIIRLLLERRHNFQMYGGVRFGGTITYNIAKELGFDHIALASGAGRPNLPKIKNLMSKGVRTASDFLMSLQLGGATRLNSLTNIQIRLPVIVIGGGLTAIDTATEALAYYPKQVEKFLTQYQILVAKLGINKVRENWSDEDKVIADEYIEHALALKSKTKEEQISFLKSLGGVRVLYRGKLINAPSYRLNYEEIEKAMEEQIEFIEEMQPLEIIKDEFGWAKSLLCDNAIIAAKTILIATGTSPNTILSSEDPDHFKTDGKYFQIIDELNNKVTPEKKAKPNNTYILLDNYVSCIGDLHPSYSGSVVKAMASAKKAYPIISDLLAKNSANRDSNFQTMINDKLIAKIHKIERLTENIVEIIVQAPLAAANFKPGQFYRLQNFEIDHQLPMEGLALTGAEVDQKKGLISLITIEIGASSNLCAKLKENQRIILMGPTGTPTEITPNENVMLIGGGLGNAVLFSIGKAYRELGSKVLYFAGYRKKTDRYKIKKLEEAADHIIWACDEEELAITRDTDYSFKGNIIKAIEFYANTNQPIELESISKIIAIGSDGMMSAVQNARKSCLNKHLNKTHLAIASINSPMQCMMKEICGQCIQRHFDQETGLESFVYSCNNQDQNMDLVDFTNLKDRLTQNSLSEKLSNLYHS